MQQPSVSQQPSSRGRASVGAAGGRYGQPTTLVSAAVFSSLATPMRCPAGVLPIKARLYECHRPGTRLLDAVEHVGVWLQRLIAFDCITLLNYVHSVQ